MDRRSVGEENKVRGGEVDRRSVGEENKVEEEKWIGGV